MIDLFGIRKRRQKKIERAERHLRIIKIKEEREERKKYLSQVLNIVVHDLKAAVLSKNKEAETLCRQERNNITKEMSEL